VDPASPAVGSPPPSLVILDLEADQRVEGERRVGQTIELGAVVLRPGTGVVSEHHSFVRTTWGPLSPFIRDFCGYDDRDAAAIGAAPEFPDALGGFLAWAHAEPGGVFASWGDYDRKQLLRDGERHGVAPHPWLLTHVNLKARHGAFHRRKPCGMATALDRLGVPLEGRHHRALDDARNIARIAADLMARGADLRPEVHSLPPGPG
jgi:3'-5' exoribonuclease 1